MVLAAHEQGIKGTLVFNDTLYNRQGAREVLEKLSKLTGFPLKVVRYDGEKRPGLIIRESFLKVPMVLKKTQKTKKFRKSYFPCCKHLKHDPTTRYFRSISNPKNAVLVMGIKGADGSYNRRIWLAELRKKDTFYRRHKKNGLLYYYPLRDCNDSDIKRVLGEGSFDWVQSSGCRLCPVFCIFPGLRRADPATWAHSNNLARCLDIDYPLRGQTELLEFLEEDDEEIRVVRPHKVCSDKTLWVPA